jgi:threonine dehydrogenase-like Zn-dependent dehydrogenase
MHGAEDVRVEERQDPTIVEPTDAIIRLAASCIRGSDLSPYRGAEPVGHQVMGHEYVAVVESKERLVAQRAELLTPERAWAKSSLSTRLEEL